MLIVTEDHLLSVMPNVIILSKDDLYYYAHRSVYDKALILSDRYPKAEDLLSEIGRPDTYGNVASALEILPKPLDILSPYLSLIDMDISGDIQDMVGALSVITSTLDVLRFTRVKKEIRSDVSFSLSLRDEYELSWDKYKQDMFPYEKLVSLVGGVTSYAPTMTPSASSSPSSMSAVSLGNGIVEIEDNTDIEAELAALEAEWEKADRETEVEEEEEKPVKQDNFKTSEQKEDEERRRLLFT